MPCQTRRFAVFIGWGTDLGLAWVCHCCRTVVVRRKAWCPSCRYSKALHTHTHTHSHLYLVQFWSRLRLSIVHLYLWGPTQICSWSGGERSKEWGDTGSGGPPTL